MAKKVKRQCKWKKGDIEDKFDEFLDIIRKPKFVCKKCGMVANKKELLHKPFMLK